MTPPSESDVWFVAVNAYNVVLFAGRYRDTITDWIAHVYRNTVSEDRPTVRMCRAPTFELVKHEPCKSCQGTGHLRTDSAR